MLQAEYNRRVGIERAQHDLFCQPIRQRNAERHEAAAGRREQRRQVEEANDELVLAAEQLHQQRLYEVCCAAPPTPPPPQTPQNSHPVYTVDLVLGRCHAVHENIDLACNDAVFSHARTA